MAKPKLQGELPLAPVSHRGEQAGGMGGPPIVTIGHSTRPLDEFLSLLRQHGVGLLADVRAFPRSRRNPQFNIDTLPEALGAAGIGYRHLADLGGRRTARPDSPNGGWREPGFRGFADYMDTAAFAGALSALLALADCQRVAVMCAEAQPWRCHRSLISDALVARAAAVEHIMGPQARWPHQLPPFARLSGTRVSYPAVLTE
jgi:uncharacterized protein (DUF488 family)